MARLRASVIPLSRELEFDELYVELEIVNLDVHLALRSGNLSLTLTPGEARKLAKALDKTASEATKRGRKTR